MYGVTEDLWAQPRCQCSGKRRQQRRFCRGCCTSSVSVHTRLCACTGVHGCPPWCTRVGHGPCSRGTRLHTPQGSASPQYPCPAAPALWPLLELSSGRSGCQAHLSVGDPLFLPPVLLSSQGHWCIFPSPFHTSSTYTLFAPFWHLPCSLPHSLPPIPSTEVS